MKTESMPYPLRTPPDVGQTVEIEHENGNRFPATWDGKHFCLPGTEHRIEAKVKWWRSLEN